MDATQEEWRPAAGYEGDYEVSSLGRVHSLLTDTILRPATAKTGGYKVVNLSFTVDGRRKQHVRKIDHLVLESFVGPRPAGDTHSRHLNDDPRDNRLVNLQWGTRSENYRDAVSNGKHPNAAKTHCKRGHEFTPENTIKNGPKGRGCRECRRIRAREWERKRRKHD